MYFRPDVDTRARAHTWAIADRMMPVILALRSRLCRMIWSFCMLVVYSGCVARMTL